MFIKVSIQEHWTETLGCKIIFLKKYFFLKRKHIFNISTLILSVEFLNNQKSSLMIWFEFTFMKNLFTNTYVQLCGSSSFKKVFAFYAVDFDIPEL